MREELSSSLERVCPSLLSSATDISLRGTCILNAQVHLHRAAVSFIRSNVYILEPSGQFGSDKHKTD